MKLKSIVFFATILATFSSYAQKDVSLSGIIKDAQSGELLTGATIAAPEKEAGTYSNEYGFYSLSLPPEDSLLIVITYVGYKPQAKKVAFREDRRLDIGLESQDLTIDKVEITDNKARQNVERAVMGVIDIPIEQIEMMPMIGGEKDLFKALQLLPGVQGGSEGSSGFYVRGGQSDQNLIMLDEAIVYNPFHLAGYLSVFNSDAVRNITLYKGSFPAQYGGRLSSILDIQMKEGNNQSWHGEGGLGLISSRLTLEGPLKKDKGSVMVSGRRFYWDLLVKPFLPPGTVLAANFYDLNAKVNYSIGQKDRVYLSGYFGNDVFRTGQKQDTTEFGTYWGNRTFTGRWNHIFNDKLFVNTSVIYSKFDFNIGVKQGLSSLKLSSGIEDWNGKVDFDYYPNLRHKIRFGAQYVHHSFTPSSVKGAFDLFEIPGTTQQKQTQEAAIYVDDEWTVSEKISMNIGARAPYMKYKNIQYFRAEPRLTFKYQLNHNSSLKAGYTLMNQYNFQVSSSAISLPFDLWIPATDTVKPQQAHQIAAGIFQNLFEDKYEGSIEAYYKYMSNQIEYKEGANLYFNSSYQKELVFGKGWSYGAEFFLRKRTGRFTGWLSYTLAWTWRQFDEVNNGIKYPAKYDRRHNISLVAMYKFNEKWSFAATAVYYTGNVMTLPQGQVFVPLYGWQNSYSWYSDYVGKNTYRMQPYHRLDLGLRYVISKSKKFENQLHIDIYNTYNRRNPYFVYMTQERDDNANATTFAAKQVSLIPMLPTLTWQFKF